MITNFDENGELVNPGEDYKRLSFKQKVMEMKKIEADMIMLKDENKRRELLNKPEIAKLGEEIKLLHAKGLTEEQIMENLKRDIKLKDAEIAWNSMGLTKQSLGEFLKIAFQRLIK